jgi:glycosyltransferase involved in cell wall biosynthesis
MFTQAAPPQLPLVAANENSPESLLDNVFWQGAAPRISICVPSYRHDCSDLIDALARCKQAALAEIIIYDDGGRNHDTLAKMQQVAGAAHAAVRIASHPRNRGRSAARNGAIAHARSEWILLLDADMSPDTGDFISNYLDVTERLDDPAVVVGGYSLRFAPTSNKFALHRWQAEKSECLNAEKRNAAPGRYVFSSNVLVHRQVLDAFPFDEGFTGWGWEDTDWGLCVEGKFPIHHIDNPATHLGLDDDRSLMTKYQRSGGNFARMAERHPEAAAGMPLYKAALSLKKLPFRSGFRVMARLVAKLRLLPVAVRGRALKAWRALVYAEAL